MSNDIDEARALVSKALAITRRTKVSERAEKFLKLADANLRHPEPVMLRDLASPFPDDIDMGNVFVTLDELCEKADLSRTTIRMLVNKGYLEQKHRGLYRICDFLEAWGHYHADKREGRA